MSDPTPECNGICLSAAEIGVPARAGAIAYAHPDCPKHNPAPARRHVLTWDWREQPDLDRLARIVNELSGNRVHIAEAETGDDQFAILIADVPVTDADASDAYQAHRRGEDA